MQRRSFFGMLESLQNKPESTRRRVLVIIMIIIMAAVFASWIRSLTTTISNNSASIGNFDKILNYGQKSETK